LLAPHNLLKVAFLPAIILSRISSPHFENYSWKEKIKYVKCEFFGQHVWWAILSGLGCWVDGQLTPENVPLLIEQAEALFGLHAS
jgi:hypothetical protein